MKFAKKSVLFVLLLAFGTGGCKHNLSSSGKPAPAYPTEPWPMCVQIVKELAPDLEEELSPACAKVTSMGSMQAQAGAVLWLSPRADRPAKALQESLAELVSGIYGEQGQPVPEQARLVTVKAALGERALLLGQGVGQGLGAAAVVYLVGEQQRVLPVMPLARRFGLAPPGDLPLGEQAARSLAAAVLANRADEALSRADFAGACILSDGALELAPAAEGPCSFRGPLYLLRLEAADRGGCEADETWERFGSECLDATLVDDDERRDQAFFRFVRDLVAKRGGGWDKDKLPEDWSSRVGRKTALTGLRDRAQVFGGVREAFAEALLDELEAFFLRPDGPCDEETPVRREEALDLAAERLRRLGRSDLVTRWPGGALSDGAALSPGVLAEMERHIYAKRERYRLSSELASLLFRIWTLSGMRVDPSLSKKYCQDYFDELNRQQSQDSWPGASDRNLARLTGTFSAAVACSDRSPLQALFTRALDESSKGERGKLGVLLALAGFLPDLIGALLGGQNQVVMTTLAEMHRAVEGQMGGLGDSEEDRALGASLQMFLAIQPALGGQMGAAIEGLERAERDLAALAFPPADDAAWMVRIAPGCHLASAYLLATGYWLAGATERVPVVLARLRTRIEKVVPYTMNVLGAQGHAKEATALALAIQDAVVLMVAGEAKPSKDRQAALLASLDAAWPALPDKGGVWNASLAAGQLILADLVVVLGLDDLQDEVRDAELRKITGRMSELLSKVRSWWDLSDPNLDFLRLLPVSHEILAQSLALPEDHETRLVEAVYRSRAHLKRVLDELRPDRTPDQRLSFLEEQGSFPSLVMEAVWAVDEAGLDALRSGDQKALARLSARMERVDRALAARARVEFRALLDVSMGLLLAGFDRPRQAADWLGRGAEGVVDSDLAPHRHLFQALRARVLIDADPVAARRQLRAAMALGVEAQKCGKAHPVHAHYLPLAWLAARAGEFDLAQAQIDRYLKLVKEGFEGDGKIKCAYQFHSANLVFTSTLEAAVANLIRSTTSEQSWQMGMGGQSQTLTREMLGCEPMELGHLRHHRVVTAQLLGAFFALSAGDDRLAGRRLRSLNRSLALVSNGSQAVLSPFQAGGIEFARKNHPVALMYWTGVLAQLRGHSQIGLELEKRSLSFGFKDDDERLDHLDLRSEEPPALLEGIAGLDHLRPALDLWSKKQPFHKGFDTELREALNKAADRVPEAVPRFGPDLVAAVHQVGEGAFEKAVENLAGLTGKVRAHPRLEGLAEVLMRMTGKSKADVGRLGDLLSGMAEAGFVSESLQLADAISGPISEGKGVKAAVTLIRRALGKDETALDGLTRSRAALLEAQLFLAAGDLAQVQPALKRSLEHGRGLYPLQQELNREWEFIQITVRLGRYKESLKRIEEKLELFTRAMGAQSPAVYLLSVQHLALGGVTGQDLNLAEVDRLLKQGGQHGDQAAAAVSFLKKLKTVLASKGDTVAACRAFLKG